MPQPPKGEAPRTERRPGPAAAAPASSDEERLLTTPVAALLDLLPDAAVLYDRHGHVVQANPAAQQLLALGDEIKAEAPLGAQRSVPPTPCDLDGRPIPPAEWPLARLLRGEAVTGDSPLVMGATSPAGREVLVNCTGSPIYDPAGTLIGAIAIFRDVTAQVRHEAERAEILRREQEARAEAEAHAAQLEAVLETAPSRITIFDAAGTIVRFNRAARRHAGARHGGERLEEIHAAYALRCPTGEPFSMAEFPVARALRGETVSSVEMIRRAVNGEDEVLLVGAAPVVDAAGQVQGAVAVTHDVTALRAAERAAAERAGQLEAIFAAIADGVFVYDAAGRIIRTNPAAGELLALDAQPEYSRLPLDQRKQLLAPRDREGRPLSHPPLPVSEALRGRVLRGETALELILQRMDGRPIDVSLTAAPIRDSSTGQIVGAVSILRDVSDRRRLEREILARASQLEASVAAITDIVHIYDREGRLVHANAAAMALDARLRDPSYLAQSFDHRLSSTGLTDGQGRPLAPAQTPAARVLHGEVLTGEQAADVWVRMPDGQGLLLNTTGSPVRDPDGAIIGAVIVSRDVTERRRLEHRTREALDAMLAMAHALVDEVPAVSDGNSAASASRATAQRLVELARGMLGCERASLLAYSLESGKSEPLAMAGLTPEVEHLWRTTIPQIVPADYLDDADIEALLAGRPVVSVYARARAHGYPTYDAAGTLIAPLMIGGKLIGTLSLGYGALPHEYAPEELALAQAVAHLCALIIERDRLLGQRAAAEARVLALEDANRRMDEFLGIASHELRTPVTAILTNLQLLARRRRQGRLAGAADGAGGGVSEVEAAREAQLLARAERQLGRLVRLIDDLVDVSRIRTGKLELRPERTDLVALVREEVDGQRLAHAGRTITLHLPHDLADRAAWIMADADRISQVLTNHLSNALKYSQDDRPVEVRLQVERGTARVTVRDEGPGIPEDEQAHVWDVFHRVPGIDVQSGSGVGLGLGLHIARTIVERHGGQVGVESVPGQGSSFWFTLPLATSEDGP